jgi:hypothetical protein
MIVYNPLFLVYNNNITSKEGFYMKNLLIQLNQAKEELKLAEQNFAYAEKDFVDIAIEELNLKLNAVDLLVRKIKTLKEMEHK